MKNETMRYSELFKLQVVSELEAGRLSSVCEARRKYSIRGGGTVSSWIRKIIYNHASGSKDSGMKEVQSGLADCSGGGGVSGAWRLAREQSPYLLQHAGNSVEWFPWGQEAFDKAAAENKPIFLSIGYSSCHWCHVMAHESFEDAATAELLNRHFVCVKVDREERPDIDRVYMSFVQATTGSGGWPLSVWLTTDLKPFFGGTYFPPKERWNIPGFKSVLLRISDLWSEEQDSIASSADELAAKFAEVHQSSSGGSAKDLSDEIVRRGFLYFTETFDSVNGGFGQTPKFPTPPVLGFLLLHHRATGDKNALDMATTTLRKMAEGGIHDHIGGGFHRYSTDAGWVLPHFEKMLYDQAQLATVYLNAYLATDDDFFAEVAKDTLGYIQSGLAGPEGEFHSAEDADSQKPGNPDVHSEGAFYLWSHDEIVEAIGPDRAKVFCVCHGIYPHGNIPADPHGEFKNLNIIRVVLTEEETAKTAGIGVEDTRRMLDESKGILLARRSLRPRPFKDDKAVLAWNALAISAFALAATALDSTKYLDTAAPEYFSSPSGDTTLIYRPREDFEGSEPAGNSITAINLLRISQILGDEQMDNRAKSLIANFAGKIYRAPHAMPMMLSAMTCSLHPPPLMLLSDEDPPEKARQKLKKLRQVYAPYMSIALVGKNTKTIMRNPAAGHSAETSHKPAFLMCSRGTCRPPSTNIDEIIQEILRA
ncbi:MAG: DUF255 domain-containing protein [Victivallales bacterium]|nr:DUF255 domain-containing protein [Victivallales bacterium]